MKKIRILIFFTIIGHFRVSLRQRHQVLDLFRDELLLYISCFKINRKNHIIVIYE